MGGNPMPKPRSVRCVVRLRARQRATMSDLLPTVGILFSVQIVLACLHQGRVDDALLVLEELARELIDDCVAEVAEEVHFSTFQ